MEFIRTNAALIGVLVTLATLVTLHLTALNLSKTKWLEQKRRFVYLLGDKPESREDTAKAFFRKVIMLSSGASVLAYAALSLILGTSGLNSLIVSSLSILAWVSVFGSMIDVKTKRIPSEPFKYAYLGGALLGILASSVFLDMANLDILLVGITWGGVLFILFAPALFAVGGMSDVRFLLVAALLLWWWMPYQYALFAFFGAAVVGLLSFGLAKLSAPKSKGNKSNKSFLSSISAGVLKPANIKMIEQQLDEGKASEAGIREWLAHTRSTATSGTLPFVPYLAPAYFIVSLIALYRG